MSDIYEPVFHENGRNACGATGHVVKNGRSLCGFERPHMNIEWVNDDIDHWITENRYFENMCRRCLATYEKAKAAQLPAEGKEQA